MRVYYGKAVYGKAEIAAAIDVLKNKSISLIDGPSVKDLEKKISKVSFKLESGGTRSNSYYSDASNIGKKVEDNFSSHGVDMPTSIRDSIDNARRGKMPNGLDL